MKRSIFVLTLFYTASLFAQSNGIFTINAGYMNPKDTKAGMIVGAMMTTAVDEAVDIGVSVDVFRKNYSDEAKVAQIEQTGLTSETYQALVDYTRTWIPVHLVLNVKIPMSRYFGYFIRGSLGYSFLFSKEKNYDLGTSQTRKFAGLGWRGGGGFFYQVGTRSTLFGEAFFNSNEVSRDISKSDKDLPISERVDLSGLGFRLGVALEMR